MDTQLIFVGSLLRTTLLQRTVSDVRIDGLLQHEMKATYSPTLSSLQREIAYTHKSPINKSTVTVTNISAFSTLNV